MLRFNSEKPFEKFICHDSITKGELDQDYRCVPSIVQCCRLKKYLLHNNDYENNISCINIIFYSRIRDIFAV